jgi:hypothetical protein
MAALALARWVSDLVNDSTGRNCFVRPVVLYPGWFIELAITKPSVWVLNPRMLPGWLTRERTCLGAEDIALISFHISRYMQSEDHVALDDHTWSQ